MAEHHLEFLAYKFAIDFEVGLSSWYSQVALGGAE